jgi:microcystin-dependent protein
MPFTTPATVSPGDKYNASAHNIIVGDLTDLDTRLTAATAYTVPAGSLTSYVGAAAPSGWLLCDGSQVSQSTYSALYAIIGANKFGTDTGGNFFLPDLRGRVPVGLGTNADVDVIGDNDGAALANRSPKHQHTVYDPTHGHVFAARYPGSTGDVTLNADLGGYSTPYGIGGAKLVQDASTGVKVNPQNTATSTSPVDGPSFLTLNFIIKT